MKAINWLKFNWKYFIKYAIVGVSGTLIDVFGFATLLNYTELRRPIAATFSFIAAATNNYTWNRVWTFKSNEKNIKKQYIKFLTVATGGLILNLTFLEIFASIIAEIQGVSSSDLTVLLNTFAKIGASGTVLIYNFLVNRYWTFGEDVKNGNGR